LDQITPDGLVAIKGGTWRLLRGGR